MIDDEVEPDILLRITQFGGEALERTVFAGQERGQIKDRNFFVGQLVGKDDFGGGHGRSHSCVSEMNNPSAISLFVKSTT